MTGPAVVIIAHDRPAHLQRLIRALDPLPIFLHIDANTPEGVHRQMTAGLPDRVVHLDRLPAGWARREVLDAELLGYRAALSHTDADHIIVLTGSDYPLVSTAVLSEQLAEQPDTTFAEATSLPYPEWGPLGGWDRFVMQRQWPWRRHRMMIPLPRRIPRGIRPTAGAQTKVICRADAHFVLRTLDSRPDLARFFSTCWIPDEVTVLSLLSSTRLGANPGPLAAHPWYIDWGPGRAASPRDLNESDFPQIALAARRMKAPVWFARKFGDSAEGLLDRIDTELRQS